MIALRIIAAVWHYMRTPCPLPTDHDEAAAQYARDCAFYDKYYG